MGETRRDSIKMISAAGITCGVVFSIGASLAQEEHQHARSGPHYVEPPVHPFEPKFFTVEEGLVIARVADLIIPATDTPGALAAGVPGYVDSVVSQNSGQQTMFRRGVAWLNSQGKPFLEMSEKDQMSLLLSLSEAANAAKLDDDGGGFFLEMKKLTVEGYYTSYAGLVQELSYKGNQALATFEGCAPEH